jgi:DNA recombination protein RmuC
VESDLDLSLLLLAILFLVAGLGFGWMLGNRRAVAAEERAKLVPELQDQLESVRRDFSAAQNECASLRSAQAERERAFEERLIELREAREALTAQFSEIGGKLLGEAQKHFLERADARFNQAGEKNEEKLKALLQPVEATLKRYEEGLKLVEKERVDQYAGLREAVELVRAGQTQVRDETAKLVNALRASPKARGRWGEQSLRNVLEQAGLSAYADFESEVSIETEDGRLRPDVIIRLPGGRKLIIDAKCSLNAFLDASEEVDETTRATHLKAHAVAIRNHATRLGSKNYWEQFGDAADYVVMYIPGEQFLFAALEQDEALWEWAFERRVLLATPTNLVAIAKTVANIWRQERLVDEARKVDALGKELHERLAVAATHLRRVGGGLNSAVENYNKFVASFEGRVLVSARRFRDLSVGTGSREIEAVDSVDALAREPTADMLPAPAESDSEAERPNKVH